MCMLRFCVFLLLFALFRSVRLFICSVDSNIYIYIYMFLYIYIYIYILYIPAYYNICCILQHIVQYPYILKCTRIYSYISLHILISTRYYRGPNYPDRVNADAFKPHLLSESMFWEDLVDFGTRFILGIYFVGISPAKGKLRNDQP